MENSMFRDKHNKSIMEEQRRDEDKASKKNLKSKRSLSTGGNEEAS